MTKLMTRLALIPVVLFAIALGGCLEPEGEEPGAANDDLVYGQYALEMNEGGFTADDEGVDEFFDEEDEATLDDEAGEYEDDAEAEAKEVGPEGKSAVYRVMIRWGQFPFNPALDQATNWNGVVAVKGGKLFLKKLLLFEGNDMAASCLDHHCALVNTATLPHNDGVVLTVVTPVETPAAQFKLVVKFAGLYKRVIGLKELAGLSEVTPVDHLGNKVVIMSHRVGPCPKGFMGGKWKRLGPKGGIFAGKWQNAGGGIDGKLAGIWGKRKNGKRVFFGLYVGKDKKFKGLLKGTYTPAKSLPVGVKEGGFLIGHWVGKNGGMGGVLKGIYHIAEEGGKGSFKGKWHAKCPKGPAKGPQVCPAVEEIDPECADSGEEVCEPMAQPGICKCKPGPDGEEKCACAGCMGEELPDEKETCLDDGTCGPDDTGTIDDICQCVDEDAPHPDCLCLM